jgi:hypothetical protein
MVACWLFPFLYQTLLDCLFLYPLQLGGIGWLATVVGVGQFVDVLVGCWLRTLGSCELLNRHRVLTRLRYVLH